MQFQEVQLIGLRNLQEVHDYLKSLCSDVQITRGEYDEDTRYPETRQLTIGAFKIGICHGHQVLLISSLWNKTLRVEFVKCECIIELQTS